MPLPPKSIQNILQKVLGVSGKPIPVKNRILDDVREMAKALGITLIEKDFEGIPITQSFIANYGELPVTSQLNSDRLAAFISKSQPIEKRSVRPEALRMGIDRDALGRKDVFDLLSKSTAAHEVGHAMFADETAAHAAKSGFAPLKRLFGAIPEEVESGMWTESRPKQFRGYDYFWQPDVPGTDRGTPLAKEISYAQRTQETGADKWANWFLRRNKASPGQPPIDERLEEELAQLSVLLGRNTMVAEAPAYGYIVKSNKPKGTPPKQSGFDW